MTKGYWIVRIDVIDPDRYARYRANVGQVLKKFDGRFLVRAGTFEKPEGQARSRNVVIEFPSYQAAVDCYHSAEYHHVKAMRLGAAECDLIVIEGYDAPQA